MLSIVLVLLLVLGCFPTKLYYTNGGPALLHKLAASCQKPEASNQLPETSSYPPEAKSQPLLIGKKREMGAQGIDETTASATAAR